MLHHLSSEVGFTTQPFRARQRTTIKRRESRRWPRIVDRRCFTHGKSMSYCSESDTYIGVEGAMERRSKSETFGRSGHYSTGCEPVPESRTRLHRVSHSCTLCSPNKIDRPKTLGSMSRQRHRS